MFSRPVLDYVMKRGVQSRGHFFQTEIKAYCHRFRITEAPIVYSNASPRPPGEGVPDALRHLWRLFQLRLKGELF
jgi:dolichol-phosphate mannosyltransferase